MSDHHPPIPGSHGDAQPPADEGALLFDPNSSMPDLEFETPDWDVRPPSSRMPVIIVAVLAILGVAGGGIYLTRSAGEVEAAPEVAPVDPTTPTGVPREAAIQPFPGDAFHGMLGASVTIGVRALDGFGAPIADTLVRFTRESGAGTLELGEARTNRDGIAATSITLPDRPGNTIVSAALAGSSVGPTQLTVTARAGAPATIQIVSGNGQKAEIGELLENRVFVSVTDEDGRAVPNAEIRFRVDGGDGLTAPTQTRTDSLGRASALWRLGMTEGSQRLSAISSDLLTSVTFSATALPRTTSGDPSDAPLETAPVRVSAQSYAVGGSHVCSIAGGALSCRGGNDRGQSGGQGSTRFVAITAGASHTCGLDASGNASCWGANERGQLGDGSRTDRNVPTSVRSNLHFSMLTAGASHTCGLAGAGVPLCWGLNLNGQLGDGSRNDQTVPRTVGGGLVFRSLTAGWSHTCGLTENGNAFCWGLNSQGQLGDGGQLDRLVPTLVRGAVETLVAGSAHTCGIAEGQVLCWGGNSFGQLGNGTTQDRAQPEPVTGLPGRPVELAAGAVHTCALIQGGQAYCWGQNLQGQLGDGTTQNRATPVAVAGDLVFTEIHAGGAQTCGTTTGGAEYCWGLNQSGQLGDGTRESRSVPTQVAN